MKTANVLAAASFLFASFAEAAPLHKRDMVVVTATQEVVETVELTTTVYVDDLPTSAPAQATPTSDGGLFYEQPSSQAASSAVEVIPTAVPETSVAPEISTPVVPSTPIPTSTAQATSTVAEVSSVYEAPSSVYTPPPAPSTTEAPTSVYIPIPSSVNIPATSAVPAPSSSSVPNNSDSTQYSGDITYYNPGGNKGSCGTDISDDDMAVAIAGDMMNSDWCGKYITLYNNGKSVQAKALDLCPGCAGASIDVTPAVWAAIADGIDGRGHDFKWSYP